MSDGAKVSVGMEAMAVLLILWVVCGTFILGYALWLVLAAVAGNPLAFGLSPPARGLGGILILIGLAVAGDTVRVRKAKVVLDSTAVTLLKMVRRSPLENPGARTEPFVPRGPYRWVRNPMYLGVVMEPFGLGILFTSTSMLLWGGVVLGLSPDLPDSSGREGARGALRGELQRVQEAGPHPVSDGEEISRASRAVRKSPERGLFAFVVQKHMATALHYDFRLEVGGVMPSWAIPKGPTLDPGMKRLAMPTEEHDMEYRHFEGVIGEGYGAGAVMIWDEGTFTPEVEVSRGVRRKVTDRAEAEEVVSAELRDGNVKFTLYGKKLRGSFALVRTSGMGGKKPAWLLIKHRDEFCVSGYDAGDLDFSAVSGRSLSQISGR